MTNQEWDPLDTVAGTDQEVISAAKKREIKNILKSYVGAFDPMSELIQNAMDAIEKRALINKGFPGKITICVNLKENTFQVIDNGCGFEQEQFKSFIAPNISFKKEESSRGNKGVGITYIAYGFNYIEIRTKSATYSYNGEFHNGREWVDDKSGILHRPRVKSVTTRDEYFDKIDQGTSIKIKFGGTNTRPTSLSWYSAKTPQQWMYMLLIKTPLGHIDLNNGVASSILFEITVVDEQGNTSTSAPTAAKYKYPHEEIQASLKLSTITAAQKKALNNGSDPSRAIEKYKNSNGIYDFFTTNDLEEFKLNQEEIKLLKKYNVKTYGYFAYSTAVWDKVNDDKAKLRKGYRVIKGGLQLANNHMVQGELITIPLNKNIGHQHQAHILVHFDGADPDLGRKGFQPELRELGETIAVEIVNRLSARRNLLKGDTGTSPDIEKRKKIHDWIREQEDHEKNNPLLLTNDNFFLPTKKISIQSKPLSEQDVIVLFNQLLAGGVIRGIKLLSTSQSMQYDGLFRYVAEKPFENLEFHSTTNPLGVYSEQLHEEYSGPPQILEYKFSLDGLIREFKSGDKEEKDITLAVFWEFGEEYKKEYTVTSLLDFDNIHQRKHHGLTHILRSSNSGFDAICLKELIDLLNDPSGQQKVQQQMYDT